MIEVELPDVGEGVAEGEIVAWHVDPGDEVVEDDLLVEVETDKAVVDIPSSVAGTVADLHAEEGEVVAVGDVIVTIEPAEGETDTETAATESAPEEDVPESDAVEDSGAAEEAETSSGRIFAPPHVRRLAREMDVDLHGLHGSGPGGRLTENDVREAAGGGGSDDETVASAITAVDDEAVAEKSPSKESDVVADEAEEETGRKQAVTRREPDGETDEEPPETEAEDTGTVAGTEAADRERTLAAPATRRLAEELGVDVDDVPTERTRDGEPLVKPEDVRAYAEGVTGDGRADTASGAGEAPAAAGGTDTVRSGPKPQGQGERREPYRGIRRSIGQQMERSAYTAPHVSHHESVEVSALVDARAKLRQRMPADVSLTYLPFVLKAVVAGLQAYPILNTTLDEEAEEIVFKEYYDIGVAVATDDGLLVPVVRDVDEKGIIELARETRALADRARAGELRREEMQGGTFSITNFGAIGGEYATPIINYPETAILGLGAIEERPWVEDGEVVARPTLPLSLSIDHRVVDGAEAARFVNAVADHLETPALGLLE